MKKIIFPILVIFLIIPKLSYAWDGTGHRIIAQIAYDNLTPAAKTQVDRLTQVLDPNFPPPQRFLFASTWADQLKNDAVTAFNNWHFIDYPYSKDGTATRPPENQNVVWAINQSEQVLQSPKANNYEKAVFLRFLIHFVGDAHQPLHCIDFYSKQFPQGDASGNLFTINDPNVQDLHAAWDQGLGLFRTNGTHYPLTNREVRSLAGKIEQEYPENSFGRQADDLNPTNWAQQSYNMAVNFAYNNVQLNQKLAQNYITQGQKIVAQQIALSGYRLANLLNQLFK